MDKSATGRSRAMRWGLLGIILLAGAYLRFTDLGGVPPGLWMDEALNGQDAAAVWREGGHFKLVYPEVFPREPMFETLLALAVRVFGARVDVMRAVSAMIGMVTVFLLYGMLRAAFAGDKGVRVDRVDGEWAALAGAGTLAVLRWHAIFSRIILRTIILAAWMTGLVWAALAYRRRPCVWRAAWVGIMLGGGFYTYLAWYFLAPFLITLAGWLIWQRLKVDRAGRAAWHELGCMALAAALVLAPLGVHYLRVPQDLLARPGAVSVFSQGAGEAWAAIGKNFGDMLLMFHWRGDHVARHGVPHAPALDGVQGIAMIVGLMACGLLARRGRALGWILPAWLACGMLATIFTVTDSPNTLRTLCVTPALAGIVGLGLAMCAGRMPRRWGGAFIITALLASFLITHQAIFVTWAKDPQVWREFKGDAAEMGRIAAGAPSGAAVFLPQFMFEQDRTLNFFVMDDPRAHAYGDWSMLKPWPPTQECAGQAAPRERWIGVTANNQLLEPLQAVAPRGRVGPLLRAPEGNVWGLFYIIPEDGLPPAEAIERLEKEWRREMRF